MHYLGFSCLLGTDDTDSIKLVGRMNKKYIIGSTPRVPRLLRLLAKAIDLFVALILAILFHPIGIVLAICYMGLSDYIQGGQSIGKKFLGFRVVSLQDKKACRLQQSIYRNLPFMIPTIFAIIPIWGWIFSLLILVPFSILELYLIVTLSSGHRLGDVMADTTVIRDDSLSLPFSQNSKSE